MHSRKARQRRPLGPRTGTHPSKKGLRNKYTLKHVEVLLKCIQQIFIQFESPFRFIFASVLGPLCSNLLQIEQKFGPLRDRLQEHDQMISL